MEEADILDQITSKKIGEEAKNIYGESDGGFRSGYEVLSS